MVDVMESGAWTPRSGEDVDVDVDVDTPIRRGRWRSCTELDKPSSSDHLLLKENLELKKTVDLQEFQLTELHSVVAELKKKLRIRQEERIDEEDEEEEETSCDDNDDYFEDGIDNLVEGGGSPRKEPTTENKLSKILTHLQTVRKEHSQIKGRLEEKDAQLQKAVGLLKRVRLEKEALVRKVHHLQSLVQTQSHTQTQPLPNNPTCRYAVRRKLTTQQQSPPKTPTTLKGHTLTSLGSTLNSCIVEKLINLNDAAMLGELSSCSREQVELVLEKEALKVDKLNNEVDFLLGRLGEAKSVNEELVGVVGRVESWGMGWKVVAERGESTIELYDILVALLESELGLLLANVKAAGIGLSLDSPTGQSIESLLKRAEFNRDTALTAAKQILGGNKDKKVGPRLLEHQIRSLIISLKTSSAQILGTIPSYDFNMGQREDFLKITAGISRTSQMNKMDLETAVLMQELLSCREEKADLKMRLVCVERERDFLGGLVLDDNYKDGSCELNNNNDESSTSPPPRPLSLNHLASSYSLLHSSNSSLLKSLEDTKTKYRERVKLLEDRIVLLVGGGNK